MNIDTKITPRLKMVADLVPCCTLVADVGTDHGYLPIYLVNHGIVGLGFYLAMIFIALKKCTARAGRSIVHGGLFAVVISYASQSIVNISQPLTTPFYFVIMFMCCCDLAAKAENGNKINEEIKKL